MVLHNPVALGIEQALPVPGLVGLLGVRVHEHLDIAGSQQATLAHLEDLGLSENSGYLILGVLIIRIPLFRVLY